MTAYILNLSSGFKAGEYLYYFLPGISSGKILLFDEITKTPISSKPTAQQDDILERMAYIREDRDIKKITHSNQDDSQFKINIVLDYKSWELTGFGKYSAFPFAKMYFLQKQWDRIFSQSELEQITFQYFFLLTTSDEIEKQICYIDMYDGNPAQQTDYLGSVSIDGFWPKQHNDKNQTVSELENGSGEEPTFQTYLSKIEATKQEDFLKKFSSSAFLRKGKDMLFRLKTDIGTAPQTIASYDQLSALLVETVDFFGADNPIEFITNGSDYQQININHIAIDETERSKLFCHYEDIRNEIIDLQKNSQYTESVRLNETLELNNQSIEWDIEEVQNFLEVNGLKSRIPYFFSRNVVDEFTSLLKGNTIKPLEDALKIDKASNSSNGDTGSTDTLNENEIKLQLEYLRKEERENMLSSGVDIEKYEKAKSDYEGSIGILHDHLIDTLYLLPKKSDVASFYILSIALVFAFTSYLYDFPHWKEATLYTLIFAGLSAIIGLLVQSHFRKKIEEAYDAVYLKNIELLKALKIYKTQLEKLAQDIYKSTIRKKNIEILEAALSEIENLKRKKEMHREYYDKILNQIDSNKYIVAQSEKVTFDFQINFDKAPEYDFFRSVDNKAITIKTGNSTTNHKIASQLGLITEIHCENNTKAHVTV